MLLGQRVRVHVLSAVPETLFAVPDTTSERRVLVLLEFQKGHTAAVLAILPTSEVQLREGRFLVAISQFSKHRTLDSTSSAF